MELDALLKELDENLTINRVEKSGRILYIYCEINCTVAKCKYCGMESSSIYSRYIRTISGIPIPFATANSLWTKRLDNYIYWVGMKNCSLEAEKQISDTHMSV